ncbi:MAG: hypothetical protein ACYTKD_09530 [Planctomycetota bacterium]|jgi:hypothetical protein
MLLTADVPRLGYLGFAFARRDAAADRPLPPFFAPEARPPV